MAASKRKTMRGMGADAFFGESEEETSEPVSQDNGTPVDQPAGEMAQQQASMPVIQQDSALVDQQDAMPVDQHTGVTAKKQNGKTGKQRASVPVNQQDSLMKVTYYISPEHDLKLERMRLARKTRGQKVDKSALIRELIDRVRE